MTDDPNDIDSLMLDDPLSLSDQDIDRIIAYQRKQRTRREGGGKAKKAQGPAVEIDLAKLGLAQAAKVPDFKRRV